MSGKVGCWAQSKHYNAKREGREAYLSVVYRAEEQWKEKDVLGLSSRAAYALQLYFDPTFLPSFAHASYMSLASGDSLTA